MPLNDQFRRKFAQTPLGRSVIQAESKKKDPPKKKSRPDYRSKEYQPGGSEFVGPIDPETQEKITEEKEKEFTKIVEDHIPKSGDTQLYFGESVKVEYGSHAAFVPAGQLSSWLQKHPDTDIHRISVRRGTQTRTIWEKTPETEIKTIFKKAYEQTGVVPSSIKKQIVVPEEIKDLGLSGPYVKASFEEFLGIESGRSDFEDLYRTRTVGSEEWVRQYGTFEVKGEIKTFSELQKEYGPGLTLKKKEGVFIPEVDVMAWEEKYYGKSGVSKDPLKNIQKISYGITQTFDPGFWGILITRGKEAAHKYSMQKMYQSMWNIEQGKSFDEWIQVQKPAWENIILPFMVTAGIGAGLGAIGKIGAGTIAVTGTGSKIVPVAARGFSKVAPYAFIGTVGGMIGADIGLTAASERDQALGGFGSQEAVTKYVKYGMIFSSAAAGAKMAPRVLQKAESFGYEAKHLLHDQIYKSPVIRDVFTRIHQFKTYGTRGLKPPSEMGFKFWSRYYQTKDVIKAKLYEFGLERGLIKAKPTRSVGYDWEISTDPYMTGQYDTALLRSRLPKGGVGERIPSKYEQYIYRPIYGTPGKFEIFAEKQAISKLKRFKLDLMKDLLVKTETKVIIDPKQPWKGAFSSRDIHRDITSEGVIELVGEKRIKIEGITRYKLSKTDVFYQEKPFKTVVKSEYVGDLDQYMISSSKGYSMPMKEIKTQLYGHTFTEIGTGTFKVLPKHAIQLEGSTISKHIYAGETYITEKGFLAAHKKDITIGVSRGEFIGRTISGEYIDIMKIVKPQIKVKGVIPDTSGFDPRPILSSQLKTDLPMPGGIGQTITDLSYPGTHTKVTHPGLKKYSLRQLEFLESGIDSSAYWTGIKPSPISSDLTIGLLSSKIGSKMFRSEIKETELDVNVFLKTGTDIRKGLKQNIKTALASKQVQSNVQLQQKILGLKTQQKQAQVTKQALETVSLNVSTTDVLLELPLPSTAVSLHKPPGPPVTETPFEIIPIYPLIPSTDQKTGDLISVKKLSRGPGGARKRILPVELLYSDLIKEYKI